jgi:hypothetical protein
MILWLLFISLSNQSGNFWIRDHMHPLERVIAEFRRISMRVKYGCTCHALDGQEL